MAKEEKKDEDVDMKCSNFYMNYIDPFLPEEVPTKPQKINYTISIHRAMFTDEIYDLYSRYEKAVHDRETKPDDLVTHLCNSPVYDPVVEADTIGSEFPPHEVEKLDEKRVFKDEGV